MLIILIYALLVYMCVVLVWLILGAIVNPGAFLPFASAAATLITFVVGKYEAFTSLLQTGYEKVMQYIREMLGDDLTQVISLLDIQSITNEAKVFLGGMVFGALTTKAVELAVMEDSIVDKLKKDVMHLVAEPSLTKNTNLMSEAENFSINPDDYMNNLKKKMVRLTLGLKGSLIPL